jgi:hypothetical protein
MQVRTNVKAGDRRVHLNHNQAQVRPAGLKVQTSVKAGVAGGGIDLNHNEVPVRPAGVKVQTNVKAGHTVPCPPPINQAHGKPNC